MPRTNEGSGLRWPAGILREHVTVRRNYLEPDRARYLVLRDGQSMTVEEWAIAHYSAEGIACFRTENAFWHRFATVLADYPELDIDGLQRAIATTGEGSAEGSGFAADHKAERWRAEGRAVKAMATVFGAWGRRRRFRRLWKRYVAKATAYDLERRWLEEKADEFEDLAGRVLSSASSEQLAGLLAIVYESTGPLSGMPDLLSDRDGELVFVEVKGPTDSPRGSQVTVFARLIELGFEVVVLEMTEAEGPGPQVRDELRESFEKERNAKTKGRREARRTMDNYLESDERRGWRPHLIATPEDTAAATALVRACGVLAPGAQRSVAEAIALRLARRPSSLEEPDLAFLGAVNGDELELQAWRATVEKDVIAARDEALGSELESRLVEAGQLASGWRKDDPARAVTAAWWVVEVLFHSPQLRARLPSYFWSALDSLSLAAQKTDRHGLALWALEHRDAALGSQGQLAPPTKAMRTKLDKRRAKLEGRLGVAPPSPPSSPPGPKWLDLPTALRDSVEERRSGRARAKAEYFRSRDQQSPVQKAAADRAMDLSGQVGLLYRKRGEDDGSKARFEEAARHFMREFDSLLADAPQLQGTYQEPFARLAVFLEKEGRFAEAIEVAERAEALKLRDGTKGGWAARLKRLKKKSQTAANGA